MENWVKKYSEKFGLCNGAWGTCQCKNELRFIRKILKDQKEEILSKVDEFIIEEMMIVREEGITDLPSRRTSRLTSLAMRVSKLRHTKL